MSVAVEEVLRAERLGRREGRAPNDGPDSWLLQDISLHLSRGESVAVVGPSGAGKSVLLRALAGLDPIQEGEIWFRGEPISELVMPAYRAQVMYLHQRPAILEASVEENLRRVFALKVHRDRQYDAALIERYLARVDRTPSFLKRAGPTLSGGEQQLVALLRALQLKPAVLLLDEPTASIDAETAPAVERLIAAWREDDPARACLWVTHDEEQRERVAERAISLRSGRVERGADEPNTGATTGGAPE